MVPPGLIPLPKREYAPGFPDAQQSLSVIQKPIAHPAKATQSGIDKIATGVPMPVESPI